MLMMARRFAVVPRDNDPEAVSGSLASGVVPMRMRAPAGWAALLVLMCGASASAQPPAPTPLPITPPIQGDTTTIPELTNAGVIAALVRPVGAPHVGEAIGLATQLAIGTAPFGASSGGFLIKLDPSTGLQVRTATTFGPSFAERALTNGEGKVSVGVNFASVTYDRLDDLAFDGLEVRSVTSASPAQARSGVANLDITSKTVVISARMGVTDKLDIGAFVPMVTVKVNGTTTLRNGNGDILLFGQGSGASSGLGDVAGLAKYRFYSFGSGQPDPGGLALMVTMRMPTGDQAALRGLGVTRTLLSFIASSGQGRVRPHANVGFGYWSKGVGALSDGAPNNSVEARHQYEYAGGLELEAAPKVTILVDLLGGAILGGGKLGFSTVTSGSPAVSGDSLVALPEGIQRVSLAPGLKVNLKGKLLLSVNALVALRDQGLHSRVTAVAGIDLTF
jgi:hypothetical protein